MGSVRLVEGLVVMEAVFLHSYEPAGTCYFSRGIAIVRGY